MNQALVTGAAGFLGRHFAAELRARGWDVAGWDVAEHKDCLFLFHNDVPGAPYDLVVHAAARSPHRAAIDGLPGTHVYNQLLDAAMFEWAIRTGQRRVLYLSSCAVLDPEPDAYGQVKLAGERMAGQARACGVPVSVVRPYSGYGEDQSGQFPFGAFVARARRRADPFEIWGDGKQVRDWIHVDDLVAGALAVARAGTDEPVSLCTGTGTSMLQLARLVVAAEQRRALGVYRPLIALAPDRP